MRFQLKDWSSYFGQYWFPAICQHSVYYRALEKPIYCGEMVKFLTVNVITWHIV